MEINKFEENNYVIVKEAISQELANFCNEYFLLKRKVVEQMNFAKIISPYVNYLGTWGDTQAPNTYSHYSDFAMEALMIGKKELVEKESGLKVIPTYSYWRC